MFSHIGQKRRTEKIFPFGKKSVLVPFDDLLISGPIGPMNNIEKSVDAVSELEIDGIIAFPGFFARYYEKINSIPWIVNVTGSTSQSNHTHKRLIGSVQDAVSLGADAVAVHINFTDKNEGEMIAQLGTVASDCHRLGMPLMAIAYPRRYDEKKKKDDNYDNLGKNNPDALADMILHGCQVCAELGVSAIKTVYSGSVDSFSNVVKKTSPIPVVVAGGPVLSTKDALVKVKNIMKANAAGVSFGRNVYVRQSPKDFLSQMIRLVKAN